MGETNIKKEKDKSNSVVYAVIVTLIGILLVVGALYLDYKVNNAATALILMTSTAAGGALLTTALSMVTYKKSGIVEFVKKQAEEVLLDDAYISNLSSDKLEAMRTKINGELFNTDVAGDKDSLLNCVTKSIEPLLGRYYFENFYMEVKIEANKTHPHIINKTVIKEVMVKPISKDGESTILLREILRGAVEQQFVEGSLAISEEKLYIDGKEKAVKINYEENKEPNDGYNKSFELVYADESVDDVIKFGEEGCQIRVSFVSRINIQDNIIINKVDVPCKKYTARIVYDITHFDLNYTSYAFMHKEGMKTKEGADKSRIFESQNWCLPGDGIVVQYSKKK